MRASRARLVLVLGLVALWGHPAWGVKPRTWQIDEPADFLAGTLDDVALSSRAELLLAPQTRRIELDAKDADTVNTVVIGPDNLPYIGTGPNGIVYRVADDTPQKFVDVPEGQVFSLLFLPDESLLVGTGGRRGVIYRVNPDGQRNIFWQAPSVRYVWSMARDEAGNIYAATGTGGEIYKISADGGTAAKIVSLSSTKNILTLAMAGTNRLVFGTDASGLVGAVNTTSGRIHILFDAGDRSISAIVPAADGAIYVAATRTGPAAGGASGGTTPARPRGRPDLSLGDASDSGRHPATRPTTTGSATLPAGRGDRTGTANAVYRIEPSGLTSEMLSLSAMVLSMASVNGHMVVGTGSPGRVYMVQPEKERYTALVREDAAFFSAAARTGDSCWIGTSRPAALVHILPDYARQGTYTSAPQDAGQFSLWGQVSADLTLPSGTSAAVQTRSSNVHEATGPGWSDWSEPIALNPDTGAQITSPPARFLQFRLVLKTDRGGNNSPLIRSVTIPYMPQNLAPEISSLRVNLPEPGSKHGDEAFNADSNLPIEWQARDPNGDTLAYEVDLRQVGSNRWIRIAKNLRKTSYGWDSSTVPDGRYEVRVIASDHPDNPPAMALSKARISEPFVVDNAPPRIENLRSVPAGQNTFRIQARLVDAGSDVAAAQYALDSADTWVSLLPADDIFDSPTEMLDFTVGPLAAGEHILALRVADSRGNTARAWLTLLVE